MRIGANLMKSLCNRRYNTLFLCVLLLGSVNDPTAAAIDRDLFFGREDVHASQRPADIEVFVREGCPHCAKAEEFLAELMRNQPKLKVLIRDIQHDPTALDRLEEIAKTQHANTVRVPAFYLHGQLIVGYTDEATTGKLILDELAKTALHHHSQTPAENISESCLPTVLPTCQSENGIETKQQAQTFDINLLGQQVSLDQVGLPLFTVAMGLLDGFNPCSMWVLILMISLLAPMRNRMRMLAVAGVFVAVEGMAYFVFMAAWLNLFLLIGLSRTSEIVIAGLALLAGAINLKDFWAYGQGFSLTIPKSAKPGIYARIRAILIAENIWGAMLGAAVLAVLVQIVEFLCTSGFPALYTRILTLRQLNGFSYYGYLLLYNLAYMFDDLLVLGIGVITLSQRRLQEREGRWLKLFSGTVMVGLALYLLI